MQCINLHESSCQPKTYRLICIEWINILEWRACQFGNKGCRQSNGQRHPLFEINIGMRSFILVVVFVTDLYVHCSNGCSYSYLAERQLKCKPKACSVQFKQRLVTNCENYWSETTDNIDTGYTRALCIVYGWFHFKTYMIHYTMKGNLRI